MDKLLFDESGKFIGVGDLTYKPKPFRYQQKNSIEVNSNKKLMTSKDLSFLKGKELVSNSLDSTYWSLYEEGKRFEPLLYSNGKTQEDIVKETVDLIRAGKKVIFIHGVCGTGKSSIALNIARIIGKTSIVVPVKNLQKQYENDYTKKKYVLKPNGTKMSIAVITGRDNHDSIIYPGVSCADPFLPDTIIITDKNREKLFEYYRENPFIQNKSIPILRNLKRISIAPSNPYWSPIRPAEYELNQLKDARKKRYRGVLGKEYIFYHRKEGCSYYDQFQAYLDADVLIFNAAKYEIEMAIGRKPETEVDIIDEADAFLDNFSKEASISLVHLANSLQTIAPDYPEAQLELDKIRELINLEIKNKIGIGIDENKIFSLKETFIGKLLKLLVKSKALQAEISLDELHYTNRVLEIALTFDELFDDTYITYNKNDNEIYANLVTTNVGKRFSDLAGKTKSLVLMSGTLHSEDVIKNVFGIKDYVVLNAETNMPGTIEVKKSSYEINCDYKNLNLGGEKRKEYLIALSKSIEIAKKPILVHVNAFDDLPSEQEIRDYSLNNLISKERLRNLQNDDKNGELISRFKEKTNDTLFSTRCSRGVDFPGDMCNSIIFTKYPNPNVNDIFWKVLKRTHPTYFWSIYKDKAQREFLQRIYRALRSKDDHVFVLSPDSRVIDALGKLK